MPFQVAILGASGYAGCELLRIVARHPELTLIHATADRHAGVPIAQLAPTLVSEYGDTCFETFDATTCARADVVFLALPHGVSQAIVPTLTNSYIVDVAADFRLPAATYEHWYGEPHRAPEYLADFVVGIPELAKGAFVGATRIALPGCYPTATTLALAPLVHAGVVDTQRIVVSALSGVSGRGREASDSSGFSELAESAHAYGVGMHRHTPEIEQLLGELCATSVQVQFTPHLVPMVRGIVATCVAPLLADCDPVAFAQALYADAPCIRITDVPQPTKAVVGTNVAALSYHVDRRTNQVVAIGVIDNLVKGTAGQAIQALNLALGFPETCGIPLEGRWP
ncbi:MAG: N-acetyl-gamma-glutamyl-phosphate reductase [Acidimicrobiia bacterium]